MIDANKLESLIYGSKSWFYPVGIIKDFDGSEMWIAESSEYGDCSYDKPGKKDLDEADRLVKIIAAKYPDLKVYQNTVNEFVQVVVKGSK